TVAWRSRARRWSSSDNSIVHTRGKKRRNSTAVSPRYVPVSTAAARLSRRAMSSTKRWGAGCIRRILISEQGLHGQRKAFPREMLNGLPDVPFEREGEVDQPARRGE